jgi:quinol---cytochrome c reductase cytochrome c subunit, bacillus type
VKYVPEPGDDARRVPMRLLVVQGEERPAVDATEEPMVMTFPHLLVRELVAFLALSVGLVALALFFDAPLEEIADPTKTPNPAKAPWYFLGLQELLHYYPPVVSGVALPALLVVALAVIPYFDVNVERAAFWNTQLRRKLGIVWAAIAVCSVMLATTGAHAVWPLIGPLWACGLAMSAGAFVRSERTAARWLQSRSLPFWIFAWFLLSAITLTVIGIFFRGPGWSPTLPWREGMYY